MPPQTPENLRSNFETRAFSQSFLIVTYDGEGRVLSANNHFLRLMEYDLSEVLGLDTSIFFSNTSGRSHHADIWREVAAGRSWQEINLWIAKHGKEVWLDSRFIPIAGEGGAIESIVQIAEDVTQTLKREAEDRGQVEAIQRTQAVIHFSLDGTVLSANDNFLDVVGYARADVIGQHHAMFVDPAQRDSADYKAFWAALAGGQHQAGEFRRIASDGSDIWLQAVYTPICDPAGRPFKVVKYATDITAEKVRQADYKWQVRAIHKSNCVITFDMFGTILDANENFLGRLGYRFSEAYWSSRSIAIPANMRPSGRRSRKGSIRAANISGSARTAASYGCRPPTTRSAT